MKVGSFKSLKMHDVVDVSTGRYIGKVTDVKIDVEEGVIDGLIVAGNGLFVQKTIISYEAVELIGVDVVLVNLGLVGTEEERV